MLDVGFSEILLTSAIALIVLGPERLPKVARQVGNWMGRARAMARQLSEQLEREVSAEEFLKTQSKPNPGGSLPSGSANLPNTGAAYDPLETPSIAPPAAVAPAPAVVHPPGIAPAADAAHSEALPAPVSTPEPTYGLAAATPAAMHAADPPVADSKPPHE